MTVSHDSVQIGDRIYAINIDEPCTIIYKDSKSVTVKPFVATVAPLRLVHKEGLHPGLKSWLDFVRQERELK